MNKDRWTRKKLLFFGITFLLFSALSLFLYFSYKGINETDLVTVKGEYVSSREVQLVRKSILKKNTSTLIKLTAYPDNEFNIGESIGFEYFQTEIKNARTPVIIELGIKGHFFDLDKKIVPAFSGLKINDKPIVSTTDAKRVETQNKKIEGIIGMVTLLAGLTFISIAIIRK